MTRTDVIPQPLALRLQLAAIRGREPAGSLFELRHKLDSGGMGQTFHDCHQLDGLLDPISQLGRRTDVYIGCAPRTRRQGGRDSIARLWTLWADVDGADALERLRAFKPAPHMVIRSGSPDSVHAWWDLREPASPHQAERANRRLAHHLTADMRATDAARILRPAGTLNHKHRPAVPVECVHLDARRALTVDELLAGVPELPAAEAGPPRPLRRRLFHDRDPIQSIPAIEYVPAITRRPVGRDGKAQCPFHAGGQERTPSLHAYADDQGWFCFGGDKGGDVYTLGAMLYGLDSRRDFREIKRRIASDLLGAIEGGVAA
jgi:hypothetical protein